MLNQKSSKLRVILLCDWKFGNTFVWKIRKRKWLHQVFTKNSEGSKHGYQLDRCGLRYKTGGTVSPPDGKSTTLERR